MTRIRVLSVAAILMLGIALKKAPADQPNWPVEFAVSLEKSTFQTISAGVILYNQGDPAGCYRLFEGSLLGLRPFLRDYPEYAKMIEDAFASSKKLASPAEKAIELRKPLDKLLLASRIRPVKKSTSSDLPETSIGTISTEDKPTSRSEAKPAAPVEPKRVASGVKRVETPIPESESDPGVANSVQRTPERSTDPKPSPVVTLLEPSNAEDKASTSKPADDESESTAPAPSAPIDPTFWKRIGDTAEIKKVVHDFLFKATNDPRVAFDRGGKYPLDDQTLLTIEQHILELLSSRAGGPFKYRGRSMKMVHADMSINEDQFKAIIEDLEDVLFVHRVGVRERRELLDVVSRLKAEIVSPH